MPKRRLYSKKLQAACDDATTDYLEGEEVKPGLVLYITTGSVEDETTAPTTISFGNLKDSEFTPLEEDPAPIVGIRYHLDKTHHFTSGQKPAFRFEGATLADKLRAYLEGYYEEVN